MHDTAAGMFDDDKDEECAEHDVGHLGEITGPDVRGMILQKSGPGLT